MSSWPWRGRIARGGSPLGRLLVFTLPAAARFSSRSSRCLSRSSRLPAPLDRVGERGDWASGLIARRGLPRAGGGGGEYEYVDFVDVLPIG